METPAALVKDHGRHILYGLGFVAAASFIIGFGWKKGSEFSFKKKSGFSNYYKGKTKAGIEVCVDDLLKRTVPMRNCNRFA